MIGRIMPDELPGVNAIRAIRSNALQSWGTLEG
jgi:hypothetical protein